jgi:hypothetical protein
MKRTIAFLLFLGLLANISLAQNRSINQFVRKNKKIDDSFCFNVPGLVFRTVASTRWFIDKEDYEAIEGLKLMKHIKHVKVFVSEHADAIPASDVQEMIKGIKACNYEELMSVRDQETLINFYIREKKDCIRNVFVIINDGEEFICLSMRTKMKMSDLDPLLSNPDHIKIKEKEM